MIIPAMKEKRPWVGKTRKRRDLEGNGTTGKECF
jgi:hypothetical protein